MSTPGTSAPRPERRRSIGAVWLQQRPKAWLWAGAFVVVVLVAVVILFGMDVFATG